MRRGLAALAVVSSLACGQPSTPEPAPKAQPSKAKDAPEAEPAQDVAPKAASKGATSPLGKLTVGVEYQITGVGILEGERVVLALKDGRFPGHGPARGEALKELDAALVDSMKRAHELAQGFGAPEPKGAVVRADPQIHWDTLMTLLPALERAGLSEFHVDVGSPESTASPIAVALPSVLRSGEAAKTVDPIGPLLAVELGESNTVYAWVPGGERREVSTEPLEGLLAGLRTALAEHPERKGLLVSAHERMTVSMILETLEQLVGVDCLRGAALGCSVDKLYVVGANAPGYDPNAQGPLSALTHSFGVWGTPPPDGGFGVGGLGLTGEGDSGAKYGVQSQDVGVIGRGTGFSQSAFRRDRKGSRIRLSKPIVQGKLESEIVRRVLRRHFNELRFCYDKALQGDESLAGEVTLRFVIGLEGTVQASQVESATLKNSAVHACMVTANRRWAFPKPEGGIAVVKATFSFAPGTD